MRFHLLACGIVVGSILPICVALAADGPTTVPTRRAIKPFFRKPWLLGAHRGGAHLWPENTVLAFKAAAKRWPHIVLETDARLTADGHVVLLHDSTVNRTTDGKGRIAEMTLADVRNLDAGYRFTTDDGQTFPFRGKGVRIPTLAEALEACPTLRFEVELKPAPGVAEPAIRAIRQAKAEDRVLLASFDSRLMYRARKLAPEIARCYEMLGGLGMLRTLRKGQDAWASYQPKADVLSLMQRMLRRYKVTPGELQAIQGKGIYLQLHTPNTRERILSILELNPDSVLTDRPDLLAQILDERATSK
jgi:glycerophosphoryl diester phosphodiesterase